MPSFSFVFSFVYQTLNVIPGTADLDSLSPSDYPPLIYVQGREQAQKESHSRVSRIFQRNYFVLLVTRPSTTTRNR